MSRRVRELGAVLACITLGAVPAFGQPGGPPAYPADLVPTHANVPYAGVSKAQVLDLFLPETSTGPTPLVINVHGGAFRFGRKEMLDAPVARALLASGIAVASVNYRLSGEATFPAAVQDVKAAVRFLRANAARFHLDPDRFVAFGQSAGGNLVAMLGTSGGQARFDDAVLGNAGVSSRVQGVIDWFGPTDFLQMDAQARGQGCGPADQRHGEADSPESRYLGRTIGEAPDLVAQANPITYVTSNDPPFLLQKGEHDCTVPVGQSLLLAEALRAARVPVDLDLLDAGHGDQRDATPAFTSDANVARVVAFVKGVGGDRAASPAPH